MPPKIKITKEEIVKTSIELIRKNGEQAVNARAIASLLNCSTQPIFFNFKNMDELLKESMICTYNIYLNFIKNEVESKKYPEYKAFGMAYVRFAKEEPQLFRFLFMRDRTGEDFLPTADFSASVELIMKANDITKEQAELLHLEMWTCVHGIAVMMATSFLALDWELISDILSDIYHGLQKKQLLGAKN